MKTSLGGALVVCAAIAGCGAVDDVELDEVDQPFSARGSSLFSFGTRTATSAGACDRTSTGQVCYLPKRKAVTWAFFGNVGSDVTQAQADAVLGRAVDTFNSLSRSLSDDGWSFAQVPANQAASADIEIVVHKDFCSGTGSSNIDGYVCRLLTLEPTALTENMPGTWFVNQHSAVQIDIGDIQDRGANATEDNAILHHAVAHGILAHIGVGMNTLTGTFCSRRSVLSNVVCSTLRGGELCRARAYQAGGTSFSLTATGCAD